jgi:hypothetical protein
MKILFLADAIPNEILIISVVILSGLLIWLIYSFSTQNLFSNKVKRFCVAYDFLYLKNIKLEKKVDYVIFGRKFVYVINWFKEPGSLVGSEDDKYWLLKKNDKNSKKIPNPLLLNSEAFNSIITITNSDEQFFFNLLLLKHCAKIEDEIFLSDSSQAMLKESQIFKWIIATEKNAKFPDIKDSSAEEAADKLYDYIKSQRKK